MRSSSYMATIQDHGSASAGTTLHDGNVQAIELCSGREGDDAYVKLTPADPQWEALCDLLLRVEGDCGLKVVSGETKD
jgi:hypothetical protein